MSNSLKTAQSEEFVLTPGGKRPLSKVHRIPEGGRLAHVGNEIHVIDANNNVILKADFGDSDSDDPDNSAWKAYAYWNYDSSPPMQNFLTKWTVPPDPTTDSGQTIFLFNSIEPSGYPAILQPVLQWGESGAGGGSYWSIATWYLIGSNKLAFASPLTEVSIGDSLEGVIRLTGYSDTSFDYKAGFTGINNSLLTITGVRELVYVTETLEAYSITQSSDYPSGSTSFTDINVTLTDSTFPSLSWSTSSDADEGLSITVDVDGSQDGEVTAHYPS